MLLILVWYKAAKQWRKRTLADHNKMLYSEWKRLTNKNGKKAKQLLNQMTKNHEKITRKNTIL